MSYRNSDLSTNRYFLKFKDDINEAKKHGKCTSQEKVDTSGTPFSHIPYLFCTMAGSFGFQYRSLYWAGVR